MSRRRFDAVLLDRDGTLVEDVPYNGDPAAVRPMPGALRTLARLRAAGMRLGVVTNQSGLARGLFTEAQMNAVRSRIEQLLGTFDTWQVCPHDIDAGCGCRKPRPGLILAAAAALDVDVSRCAMVGDIGADVAAAQAAGATGVLVPTPRTRAVEVAQAPVVLTDLTAAGVWIIDGTTTSARLPPRPTTAPRGGHVLAVRADSAGDVLLTGPAIRAVAERAAKVTLLCGPRGRAAAELLPGVDDLIEWTVPWLDPQPPPVVGDRIESIVKQLRVARCDRAVVFTSFHQSPLPMALLLRLADVGHISAISDDYPGSLLDVRHDVGDDLAEAERALSLAEAAGYPLPRGDDGRLRLRAPLPDVSALTGDEPYVVVHPGTSVPARACPPQRCAAFVTALSRAGWRVLVTGAPSETALTSYVAGPHGVDIGGRTPLPALAGVLSQARCAIVGNTGPAHLAAAVGTPVVSLYAPTVPFERWAPYRIPVVRLGRTDAPCRGSRATVCPVLGHPCLSNVGAAEVLSAVEELTCAF